MSDNMDMMWEEAEFFHCPKCGTFFDTQEDAAECAELDLDLEESIEAVRE